MNTQYTRLSMTPSGVLPVVYMSQYDVGRPIGFICDEDLDSYTVTLEATRTDGTAITAAITTDGNIGTFETTATMTNVADEYIAQVVITDTDSNRIASIPMRMVVIKAAMDENSEAIEEDRSLYQQYTGTVQSLIADIRSDYASLDDTVAENTAAIATLQENVGKISANHILLISDSYGSDEVCGGASWQTRVSNSLTDRTVESYYWGAHAFSDKTYSLPAKIATIPASDDVDYILILCGANDGNRLYSGAATTSDIVSGIATAVATMKTNFPNASIHIGFVGRHKNPAKMSAYRNARDAYKSRCNTLGVIYADNFEYILHNRALIDDQDVHPNLEGSTMIGNYAVQYILQGSITVIYHNVVTVPVNSAAATVKITADVLNETTLVCIKGSDGGAVVSLPCRAIPSQAGWIVNSFTLDTAQYIVSVDGTRNGVIMGAGTLNSGAEGYETAFMAIISNTVIDIYNRRAPGATALTATPTIYAMFSPIVCDSMLS